jgi:D-erythronate 2-dehydrogenase
VRTTVAGMVAALAAVAGPEVADLIEWRRDPVVEAMVVGWPAGVDAARAAALGLAADPDFASIVRAHLAETGRAN